MADVKLTAWVATLRDAAAIGPFGLQTRMLLRGAGIGGQFLAIAEGLTP